ncbi:MAG: hypothetical protein CVU44_01260 [Chloroflexi bacterium HGW-Chloroflexi-6]|jgi:hypothetical protein|nr:MAG: hypothetical protein CVU44_01260 [Chloroflexi bacterium HGW-Chloroflexi-6]
MQELIDLVSKKTGLSKEQSKMAVDVVLGFIKKKLPAPVAAQVDAVLGGKGDLGAAADMLGGLLGGKK